MSRLELNGQPISPGVGVGTAVIVVDAGVEAVPERRISAEEAPQALEMLETARKSAITGLEKIQSATTKELGIQDAAIYGAQIAVLQDPDALRFLREAVAEQLHAPESAIQALLDRFERLFEQMEGGDVKNWAADLRDPWHAVLRELDTREEEVFAGPEGRESRRLVLVAAELTPALVSRHHRHPLAGLICARGGRFSHGAVLARSFGIPTVAGMDGVHAKLRNGETVVVYGDEGRVVVGADAEVREEAQRVADEMDSVRARLTDQAREPLVTACGTPIQVLVNIESPRDLDLFDTELVDGVGLFRTEFAFMERPSFPSLKEQAKIYRGILRRFAGRPVVFRTLDTGNDKPLRYFKMPQEANPALGWRGLRVSLEFRDLFMVQLQALVESRTEGDARLLLPMVTTLEEFREARALVDQLREVSRQRKSAHIQLGVMVEVPATAVALQDIAREADFVSVGTNDLIQYLFAVDRDNARVANLYQPYHPAHLRVLRHIARTCEDAGKPLSVCGEMAGYMAGALFLVGVGFRSLSIAPTFVPKIKALLRQTTIRDLRHLSRDAMSCSTAREAGEVLDEAVERIWGQVVVEANQGSSLPPGGASS